MRRCLQSDPIDPDGEEMDGPLAGVAKKLRRPGMSELRRRLLKTPVTWNWSLRRFHAIAPVAGRDGIGDRDVRRPGLGGNVGERQPIGRAQGVIKLNYVGLLGSEVELKGHRAAEQAHLTQARR